MDRTAGIRSGNAPINASLSVPSAGSPLPPLKSAPALPPAAPSASPPSRVPDPPSAEDNPAERSAYQWPLGQPRVLSPFGRRGSRFHAGIDLIQTRGGGDVVRASRAGTVLEARTRRGYGLTVLLRHADGWFTRYAHLRRLDVKEGRDLVTGDALGIVGRTGRATTAHLHFEILTPTRQPVDPRPFLFPAASSSAESPSAKPAAKPPAMPAAESAIKPAVRPPSSTPVPSPKS